MYLVVLVFFFFFRIRNIFNTYKRGGEKIFFPKKLTVMYIQNGLTLGYTVHALSLFNLYSFFNMGLTHYFFFFENTKYF